jgi:hypothetical protein
MNGPIASASRLHRLSEDEVLSNYSQSSQRIIGAVSPARCIALGGSFQAIRVIGSGWYPEPCAAWQTEPVQRMLVWSKVPVNERRRVVIRACGCASQRERIESVVLCRQLPNNRINRSAQKLRFLGSLVASLLGTRLCGAVGRHRHTVS